MFEWLTQEIDEVATPKYFVVDGPASAELKKVIQQERYGLPESYKQFVLQFGNAKLHRYKFGYQLGVLGAPVEAKSKDDEEELLCIGHYLDRRAYFKRALLDSGNESPVFESGAGGIVKAALGFEAWLKQHDEAIKKKLGKRRWQEIVKGPKPFTADEKAVVEARKLHSWKWLETKPNGDVVIEVTNGSTRSLPFYSIGVRSKNGKVNGTLFIPTLDLAPSKTKRYERECYNDLIPRGELELFTKPDPGPEDRDSYWEFK